MTIEAKRINGSFACEVTGLEMWKERTPAEKDRLRSLLSEHGVIVLRHQSLSESDLIRVAAGFGKLDPSIRSDWASKYNRDVGYISNMRDGTGKPIGGLSNNEVVWHCDQSYLPNPVTGAMLYCVETPPGAGRTSWAHLGDAYDALPEGTKTRIDGYTGIFDYWKRAQTYSEESRPSEEMRKKTPPVEHPLVNVHPKSGRKYLYIDPGTMAGIVGVEDGEAGVLLNELTEHAVRDSFVYTHEWNVGDVLIWDNGVTLHRREPYDASQCRLMKRLQFRLPSDTFIIPR